VRIISGTARGRKLFGPGGSGKKKVLKGAEIRPTADRAREALFAILADRIVDQHVVDLFAGTGALGLEAVSRGALSSVFVDSSRKSLELIQRNIAACGFEQNCTVIKRDLRKGVDFLKEVVPSTGFGVIFVDPPYGHYGQQTLAALSSSDLVASGGIIICEDTPGEEYKECVGHFELIDQRRYGDTGFWIYRNR
jgi:16S rRNA (guanine966-N2)-methyltransferase